MNDVRKLLRLDSTSRPAPAPEPGVLRPGVVTKVNPTTGEVWVTPDDGDGRAPLGPCLGATEPGLLGSPPQLVWLPLPRGRRVLITATATGTWVVALHHVPTIPA